MKFISSSKRDHSDSVILNVEVFDQILLGMLRNRDDSIRVHCCFPSSLKAVYTVHLSMKLRIVKDTDIVDGHHQFAHVHRRTTEGGGVQYIDLPEESVSGNPGTKPQEAN